MSNDARQAAATAHEDAVATLTLHSADLTFKRYCDGAVLLSQGDDKVYLGARQIEMLQRFMGNAQ